MKFDNVKDRKVYNVDLDGTLTLGEAWWLETPKVNETMKKHVEELFYAGHVIIIWTAREWKYAPETVGWLIANRIPYHGIIMGKGGATQYIDDKAVNAITLTKRLQNEKDSINK